MEIWRTARAPARTQGLGTEIAASVWRLHDFRAALRMVIPFLLFASVTYAVDADAWGGGGNSSSGSSSHGSGSRSSSRTSSVGDRAKNIAHDLSESAHQTADHARESIRQGVERGKVQLDNSSQQLRRGATAFAEQIKESVAASYRHSKHAADKLRMTMRDSVAREAAMSAGALIAVSAGIIALKSMPLYDSETGTLFSIDSYVRSLATSLGIPEGSDFGRDPIMAAFLLMFDSDYLLQAGIIPGPEGEYLSIADFIGLDIDDVHISRARRRITEAALPGRKRATHLLPRAMLRRFARKCGSSILLYGINHVRWLPREVLYREASRSTHRRKAREFSFRN